MNLKYKSLLHKTQAEHSEIKRSLPFWVKDTNNLNWEILSTGELKLKNDIVFNPNECESLYKLLIALGFGDSK